MAQEKLNNCTDLYYCISYYQVLISTLKCVKQDISSDILLSDAIPEAKLLKDKLERSKIFRNVYLIEEKEYVKSRRKHFKDKYSSYNRISKLIFGKILWISSQKDIIRYAENKLSIDCKGYNNIYVFGEGRSFAPYLHSKGIKFILVEDALDYYQKKDYDDQIERNRMSRPRKYYCINRILDFLKLYYYMGGYSSAIEAIEVNNTSNLVLVRSALKKTYRVPRIDLINKLSKEEKDTIYNAFMGTTTEKININDEACVIFTNPLVFDGLINSEEEAIFIYQSLINELCFDSKHIYLKPHPRDSVNYIGKLKSPNGIALYCINKNIPSEILGFKEDIKFIKAIAISSTAVLQASYADERFNIGMRWLDKKIEELKNKK